jgi:hypothetical protein
MLAKTEMYRTKSGERRFRVSAPISVDSYQALRRLAFDQETTITPQVRKAVEEYIVRHKPPSSHID